MLSTSNMSNKYAPITGDYKSDHESFRWLLNKEVKRAYSGKGSAFIFSKSEFVFTCYDSDKYDLSNHEDATSLANLLCATKSLNSISFHCVKLGDTGAAVFAEILNKAPFHYAAFSSAEINEQGWLAFANMLTTNSTLQSLDLSQNTITPTATISLAESLKHNTTLRRLNMHKSVSSDGTDLVGANAIADMLKVNRSLTELCLSDLSLDSSAVITIITALGDNSTICKLSLGGNYIDDECCFEFAKILTTNKALTELDISHYLPSYVSQSKAKISTTGVTQIINALKINIQLKVLKIDIDIVEDQINYLRNIAEMLAVNTSLEKLTLVILVGKYSIDSNLINSIFRSLQQNKTLRHLCINVGNIQGDTIDLFIELLNHNTTLESLKFYSSVIDYKGLIRVVNALRGNTHLKEISISRVEFGNVATQRSISEVAKENFAIEKSATAIIEMLENSNFILQKVNIGNLGNYFEEGFYSHRYVNQINRLLKRNKDIFLKKQLNTCFENVTHIPNDYETKIVSVLPEPSQHNQYVYFITPAGLFQLNYDNTDYMVILTAAQLEKISINTSHINKRLSDEQQTALNQLLLENNHCINSLDRQVAFLEHLVPGLMDESISPSSQEYWDEGYRLIKIIQRQHHFGSDIALYQLLTDSFTHAKWKNIVKEIIANLLFYASVFDRENIITPEQQLARCGLLVHYTKDQLETPEFKFAMLKIISPGMDFTIEQVQNYQHTFYPEYSEKEVDDMKQIIITLLIQANKDLEQLVSPEADSEISEMCVDGETSDTERDSVANDKISNTKKSPEVECVQSMHDGENIASIGSAVIGTNTFVENSNILKGNIKGESVAETTSSDDINDIDKWKNTINSAIAKYLDWASPENSGDKRSRFVIFTSFNHGNQDIKNANELKNTINSAESIDTVKENLSKFLQQYHKLNKHSCGTFILNELKEKEIDYQPLPTKRNTYSN